MGCGVLETHEKNVPGTALLTDDDPLASVRAYGEDIDVSRSKEVSPLETSKLIRSTTNAAH
jgi:hypothetical protein